MSDTETRSLLVIDIQILQNCGSSGDAILIVALSHRDAGLRLFQIDVVLDD